MRIWTPFLLLVACGQPAPSPPPAPTHQVAVEVDGQPTGALTVPDGEGPWALRPLLPAELPAYEDWLEVEVAAANGRFLRLKHPAQRTTPEELRVVMLDGTPGIGLYSTRSSSNTDRAVQLVLDPTAVRVRTQPRAPAPAPWPLLRVAVNGEDTGRLRQAELAKVDRHPVPGRPKREGGWKLGDALSVRVPVDQVTSVALQRDSGEPVTITGADLRGDGLWLLRQTKKGTWNVKRFASVDERTPLQTHQDITALDIRTTSKP